MNPKLIALRDAYHRVIANDHASRDAYRRVVDATKQARRDYEEAMADYNASLPPTLITESAEFEAYLGRLNDGEIVRSCFLQHQGKPTVFPCLVVSVRLPQGIGPDVTYLHRFVTKDDAAQFGGVLPRFYHYGIDNGDRPACDGAGGAGLPVVRELPTGGRWCGCCQVVLREKTGDPRAFANPGETFPELEESTCPACGAPMTFHGCVQLGCPSNQEG